MNFGFSESKGITQTGEDDPVGSVLEGWRFDSGSVKTGDRIRSLDRGDTSEEETQQLALAACAGLLENRGQLRVNGVP